MTMEGELQGNIHCTLQSIWNIANSISMPLLWSLFCLLHTVNYCVFCAPQILYQCTCNICVVILCCNIFIICVVIVYVSNSFFTLWVLHPYITTQCFGKNVLNKHAVNEWVNEYHIISQSKWYRAIQKRNLLILKNYQ